MLIWKRLLGQENATRTGWCDKCFNKVLRSLLCTLTKSEKFPENEKKSGDVGKWLNIYLACVRP